MTTPMPTNVRVGALTYTVLTDVATIKAVSGRQDIDREAEWAAFSDHDQLVIGVNGETPVGNQRRDLLHEVLHCCLRWAGVEPNAYARIVARAEQQHGGYTVEEFMVAAATGPLLAILRDNPIFTAWLLDAP